MKRWVAAALLGSCMNAGHAMGLFPHHSHDTFGGGQHHSGLSSRNDVIPAVPEPETYMMFGAGLAIVLWIVKRK
jgi:hypothetical protein